MSSSPNDYVGRIDQIDSIELDNEFLGGKYCFITHLKWPAIGFMGRILNLYRNITPEFFYLQQ